MKATIQISLDVTTTAEALAIAEVAMRAGVDWLEAGTPLVLGEGLHAVTALKARFPRVPVIADLKVMDGGYLETEMAARAGADMVVVMARAPVATVRACVAAGRQFGCQIMGDILLGRAEENGSPAGQARNLAREGVDTIVLHTSFDARHETPIDPLAHVAAVVAAVDIPVQVVGGLNLEQILACVALGAPLVVVGAPMVVADDEFAAAHEPAELERVLRQVVARLKEAS